MWRIVLVLVASVSDSVTPTIGCIERRSESRGDDDGHYCVCNATYCDEAPDAVKPLNPAEYVLITSCKSGLRFHKSSGKYETGNYTDSDAAGVITVNQMDVHQEVLGFGGAVTDSAGINILNLTHEASDNLLGNYFGPHGIDYSLIRLPMAGTDFSTRFYTYAMVENDTSLDNFTLTKEDYVYKIPIVKRAKELRGSEIKLITAPWTASLWMKTDNNLTNEASLDPRYRQVWANYFVKYFEAYRQTNLEFWGVAPQNEPLSYLYSPNPTGMAWTAEEERDWVIEYLSPTLRKKDFGHIKIFTGDENRLAYPNWTETIFANERATDIYSGTAVHFYFDNAIGPQVLDEIQRFHPNKSLIYTEACNGVNTAQRVILGSWGRGEIYARNIIQSMSHWVIAWIDWNIALDTSGGPNWLKNNVDSPIIVNSTANEFYKQPMFYALGHFSKYVPPKSVRIGTTLENIAGIENIAFSTPDGGVVLVILNLNEQAKDILIKDPEKGVTKINVLGKSINTMKYW